MAVLVNGAHEPGGVEAPCQVRQGAPLSHQNETPAPDRFQLVAPQQPRARFRWRLRQQRVVAYLAQEQVAAVLQNGEGRHWRLRESAPVGSEGLSLEAVI